MTIRKTFTRAVGIGILVALGYEASATAQGLGARDTDVAAPVVRVFADPLVAPRAERASAEPVLLALPESTAVGTRPCGKDSCLHLLDWDGREARLVARKVRLAEWSDSEPSLGRGAVDDAPFVRPESEETHVASLREPTVPTLKTWDGS